MEHEDRKEKLVRKGLIWALVAASALLAAGRADADVKIRDGVDITRGRGPCEVSARARRAHVTCSFGQTGRVTYRFRLPRRAHRVRVGVRFEDDPGWVDQTRRVSRYGAHRRHVIVGMSVSGGSFAPYELSIRRVEVRYRRPS